MPIFKFVSEIKIFCIIENAVSYHLYETKFDIFKIKQTLILYKKKISFKVEKFQFIKTYRIELIY